MDPETQTDANTEVTSSSTSGTQAAAPSQQAPARSAAEPTLQEVAKAVFDKATSSQEAEAGEVQNTDTTAEAPTTEETEEVLDPNATADEDVPFNDHPRWKEVTKKAKDFETKATELEEQTKNWEPMVQRAQYHEAFMQQNNISTEDFQQAMSFLALKNSDPAQARAMFKSTWDSLASYDEGFLPPDVQKEIAAVEQAVKDTEISRAMADKQINLLKESAKNKVAQQSATKRSQMSAQQQQQVVANSIGQTLATWESSTTKKDPAFKAKTNGSKDGVYEITCAKYAYLASIKPPRSASDASTLVEQAYKEARELLAPARPAPKPALTSARSSTAQPKGGPKTVGDTVAAVARKHGYNWTPAKR